MEKEYGKLTEGQFKRLVRKLPELRKQEGEPEDAFRSPQRKNPRLIGISIVLEQEQNFGDCDGENGGIIRSGAHSC